MRSFANIILQSPLGRRSVFCRLPSEANSLSASYHRSVGRTLIILGAILIVVGLLFTLGERLPMRLGRLPGDIVVRGKNGVFYFPIVTSLLISLVLTIVMWLIGRR